MGSTVAGFVFMVVVVVIALVCLRYWQALAAPRTDSGALYFSGIELPGCTPRPPPPFTAAAILGPGFPCQRRPIPTHPSSSGLFPASRDFSPYPETWDMTASQGFPLPSPRLLCGLQGPLHRDSHSPWP